MYYLTGYDTFGYVFFQCLYLGADGRLVLLTRAAGPAPGAAHLGHRRHPHLGRRPGGRPGARAARRARGSRAAPASGSASSTRPTASPPATASGSRRRSTASAAWPTPPTSSAGCALVKSPAELAYVRRRAAELADAALDEAHRLAGARRLRGRHPGGHARRHLSRRRRRPGQRVHHRLGPRRPALPLQVSGRRRLDAAGPAHPRVRRRLPPLPFAA